LSKNPLFSVDFVFFCCAGVGGGASDPFDAKGVGADPGRGVSPVT
jgi:hypothetical protein